VVSLAMLHHKYFFIITFFILLFLSNKTNAEFHLEYGGEALIMRDLKEIYDSGFPQILREVLNSYSTLDPKKAEDKKKLDYVAEYLPLFKEKFIVTYIEKFADRSFCGTIPSYHIAIAISPKELYSWHVTIYQDKLGKYSICDMIDDNWLFPKRRHLFGDLRKLKKYWL
jgi:hypothetical protein